MTATTTAQSITSADEFYAYVFENGHIRTLNHAPIWTRATLNMLGVNVGRGTKKDLAGALPDGVGDYVKGVFWVAYFRDSNITAYEFQNRVARRSNNSDAQFARYPVSAVFGAVKRSVNSNVAQAVADDLSPELRELWDQS